MDWRSKWTHFSVFQPQLCHLRFLTRVLYEQNHLRLIGMYCSWSLSCHLLWSIVKKHYRLRFISWFSYLISMHCIHFLQLFLNSIFFFLPISWHGYWRWACFSNSINPCALALVCFISVIFVCAVAWHVSLVSQSYATGELSCLLTLKLLFLT